jgi:hypothetical protein
MYLPKLAVTDANVQSICLPAPLELNNDTETGGKHLPSGPLSEKGIAGCWGSLRFDDRNMKFPTMILRLRKDLRFVNFAALGVPLSAVLALHYFPAYTCGVWNVLLESDLGNVLAALLAVGGYLLEHWNSRKSSRLEAQMERVVAQSHQLLIPISTQFHSLVLGSTLHFVDQHMGISEHTPSGTDGIVNSEILKRYIENPVMEMPTELINPSSVILLVGEVMMTEKMGQDLAQGLSTAMGLVPKTTTPTELPDFLHEAIKECKRPKSKLWKSYEAFVRHELLPGVQRIAEIIDENGHLMEPVPQKRLAEIFGRPGTGYGQKWEIAPRMWFYSMWLAYARSWQSVVSMWDDGVFDKIRPSMAFPVGMLFFNIEAQTMVAGAEKKLVGMSQMHGHDPNQ